MNVLSLFDGISCARVALGDQVKTYYASEVDKNAIKIALKNYSDTRPIGDVRNVKGTDYPNIDLLIGGSPCVDLSIAKKDRKGLEGEHSGLFWEYVRVLREVQPKWFILENVASMPKKDKDIITKEMGVEPILIDAALVSAQSRKRLFWTNIPNVLPPTDRGIQLKDILQSEVDECYFVKGEMNKRRQSNLQSIDKKAHCMTASAYKGDQHNGVTLVQVGQIGSNSQANRVYDPNGKSVTLSANGGGGGAKTGLYVIGRDIGRRLNEEGHREDNNKDLPIQRQIELRTDEKSGTLTSVTKDNLVVSPTRIRKLTPIECERLQSLPDNYTEGISRTQRYKCLGNAFNVEVIRHILSFLPNQSVEERCVGYE